MGRTCECVKEGLQIRGSLATEDIPLTDKAAWQSSSRQLCADGFGLAMPADQDAQFGGIQVWILSEGVQDQAGGNAGNLLLQRCTATNPLVVIGIDVVDLE